MNNLRHGWPAFVLMLVFLAACSGSRATPTPGLLSALPAPPTLPPPTLTKAWHPPTPTSPPTPSPTAPLTALFPATVTATPTPTVLSPLLLPGGYVTVPTALLTRPDGETLTVLPAGVRIGLLGRSADDVWFQALYEPGPGRTPLQGWLRATAVAVFADRARLAVVDVPSAAMTPVAGAGTAKPSPPPPTPSGRRGRLLLQSRPGGDIALFSWSDGTLRRLTGGLDPVFSPDGRQVAFTRWEEPRGLWLIHSDGSNERLVFGANRARLPTWSPDGRAIVLEIGLDSRPCYQTPFGCLTAAEWQARFGAECVSTPFGRLCLSDFALVTQEETTLVRVDLRDGSIRHLPVGRRAKAPSYHPRREELVFLDEGGLAVVDPLADDPPRRLVERPGAVGPAVYSADGEFLFAAVRSGDHWDIWRWRADGSSGVALTAPPALRREPIHNVAPARGPDGRILFLSNRRGRWELWQMQPDGSEQQPLTVPDFTVSYEFANERPVTWGP